MNVKHFSHFIENGLHSLKNMKCEILKVHFLQFKLNRSKYLHMYSEIGLKSECSSVEEEEGELEGEQVLVRPHDGGQDGDTSEIR